MSSPPDSLLKWKKRIYSEIKEKDCIECSVMGAGWVSTLWRKADTLRELSTLSEELGYMEDPSYVIKFYAFTGIMEDSDSAAFAVLRKYIKDSTRVSYGCADSGGDEPFNISLLYEYAWLMRIKYKYGEGSHDGKYYRYDKPSKKIWRQKKRMLQELLDETNSLTMLEAFASWQEMYH